MSRNLLIVPYGIETLVYTLHIVVGSNLLIVPYGIETLQMIHDACYSGLLLIVPYGIETELCVLLFIKMISFNRTLWN